MAVEHRLTTVGSLIQLLLEDPDPDRHAAALALVVNAAWPVAVLDGETLEPRLTNEAWMNMFPGLDPSSAIPIARLREVFRTGTAIAQLDLELEHHRSYLTATLQPLRRGRAVTGVIVICAEIAVDFVRTRASDLERSKAIDAERAARTDAERANRLKDQFLAAVSHELRTPLTTMMLWEKVLRDASVHDELRTRALDVIHQSAMAQSRLVGDLLDVSRAISGKLFIDLRSVDLAHLLSAAIDEIRPAAETKRVSVERAFEIELPEVIGDASRLRQVFDNLLSNALKFTPAGGRVMVAARREGSSMVVTIRDTGRGIAPEFLPRLFEPFSQTDDALTRAEGGLGLGLTIAHQLVVLHDGTLSAASEGPDRGATFTVSLPLTTQRTAGPLPVGPAKGPALHGVNVLVIDDDARVRDALALLLGRAGATVETADSAATARTIRTRFPAHVLLCDIAMPGEDGYHFVTKLRASEVSTKEVSFGGGYRTPAIALTAHATPADVRRALAAGFDLHVAKPIDMDLLVASICDLVSPAPRR